MLIIENPQNHYFPGEYEHDYVQHSFTDLYMSEYVHLYIFLHEQIMFK